MPYNSVSPKGGYQGAPPPPPFLTWFPWMWSLECLICFDLMEKLYLPPPPPPFFLYLGETVRITTPYSKLFANFFLRIAGMVQPCLMWCKNFKGIIFTSRAESAKRLLRKNVSLYSMPQVAKIGQSKSRYCKTLLVLLYGSLPLDTLVHLFSPSSLPSFLAFPSPFFLL